MRLRLVQASMVNLISSSCSAEVSSEGPSAVMEGGSVSMISTTPAAASSDWEFYPRLGNDATSDILVYSRRVEEWGGGTFLPPWNRGTARERLAFQRHRVSEVFSRQGVREAVIPAYMGLVKQLDDQLGVLCKRHQGSVYNAFETAFAE